jgi:RHS repeat-associated protein
MYQNITSLSPVGHYDNQICTDCHPHRTGFPSFTKVWNPVRRWFAELLGSDTAYAKPPAWVTDGTLPPGLQNHSLPPQAWENGLRKFKVSFEIVRQAAAQQSSQGAIKDDIIYYYHNDHLGTPCFLTDETGAIVWRREQTPFGVTTFERGTATEPLRFPGQHFDAETGLAQNWHRDYNAGLGRYVESDPIGQWGGLNLYPNANNNPLVWFDINGAKPHDLFLTQHEAAADFIRYVFLTKNARGPHGLLLEWQAWIYTVDLKCATYFTYNEPFNDGREDHTDVDPDMPSTATASAHTHGDYTGGFSTDDILLSEGTPGLAGYKVDVYAGEIDHGFYYYNFGEKTKTRLNDWRW